MPLKNPETLLSAYRPPAFLVDRVALDVDIQNDHTRVTAKLAVRRNPKSRDKNAALFLDGENQKLESVTLDGKKLAPKNYKSGANGLTISNMPARATLEIISTHDPHKNTALSGFYASGPMLITQCEAEGFRRIAFYPDRPDVMATFRVTLHADKKKYPVLLANGNLVKSGAEKNHRHFAVWEDPYPKPCYLFAMVAGKLDKVTSLFKTRARRNVLIELYTEPGKTKETGFALTALKKAMRWDEKRFGLSYDLDRFMLVATPFFNMGAMENKGLNIFNDSCVLGRPETATDGTISFIERVVGHEYFHNWTGDRITCRDWFQLSLKEGLTVFREQEFCGAMNSEAVERISNVRDLRRIQFAEDAGPMAHPVRPDHYQAIDNFYTATVYEKGAELARMIQTLVGRKGFRKGMDLYVKRHDGQAVTCDDFVKNMADANHINLSQFMLWYRQAGTPVVRAKSIYDAKKKTLRLDLAQSTPPTPKQKTKKPLHIPLALGLLDAKGRDLIGTKVLSLKKPRQTFVFGNIKAKPVVSLLRDFSAPVRLVYPQTDADLLFLLAHDTDPFNRWEAAQKLAMKYLLSALAGEAPAREIEKFAAALAALLRDAKLDAAFKALALTPPSESEIGLALRAQKKFIDPDKIFAARRDLIRQLAKHLKGDLLATHKKLSALNPRATDGAGMGKRALKNLCLGWLATSGDKKILTAAYRQATTSNNMTDTVAALGILADTDSPLRARALAHFEKRWHARPTVMDKWLSLQAGARRKNVLADVQRLMKHPSFDLKNPNRVSALIGVFAGNPSGFHAASGNGYRFVAGMIAKIDPLNPHSAARLCKAFSRWRDYEPKRRAHMKKCLRRLAAGKLSPNSHEIVVKSLASP